MDPPVQFVRRSRFWGGTRAVRNSHSRVAPNWCCSGSPRRSRSSRCRRPKPMSAASKTTARMSSDAPELHRLHTIPLDVGTKTDSRSRQKANPVSQSISFSPSPASLRPCPTRLGRQRNLFEPARRKHLCRAAVRFHPAHRLRPALLVLRHGLCLHRRQKNAACEKFWRKCDELGRAVSKLSTPTRQLSTAVGGIDRRRTVAPEKFPAADESALRRRLHRVAGNQRRARHFPD